MQDLFGIHLSGIDIVNGAYNGKLRVPKVVESLCSVNK